MLLIFCVKIDNFKSFSSNLALSTFSAALLPLQSLPKFSIKIGLIAKEQQREWLRSFTKTLINVLSSVFKDTLYLKWNADGKCNLYTRDVVSENSVSPLDHNFPELTCKFNCFLKPWYWLLCGWNWMEQNLAGLNIRMHFSCLSTLFCHFSLHLASLIYTIHTEATQVYLLNKNKRKTWGSYRNKIKFITILKSLLC